MSRSWILLNKEERFVNFDMTPISRDIQQHNPLKELRINLLHRFLFLIFMACANLDARPSSISPYYTKVYLSSTPSLGLKPLLINYVDPGSRKRITYFSTCPPTPIDKNLNPEHLPHHFSYSDGPYIHQAEEKEEEPESFRWIPDYFPLKEEELSLLA